MTKIGSLIVAFALISGCNTANDNNDNNDDVNAPEDMNTPENENPNIENTRYNNQNRDVPHEENEHRQHDGIQKKSKW